MSSNNKTSPSPCTSEHGQAIPSDEQRTGCPVDPEFYEQQCALLERNEQAARRRLHENEYWRQRTLARSRQTQANANAELNPDLAALDTSDAPLESTDAKHRIGAMLNVFMDEYNKLKPARLFLDWVSSMTPRTQTGMIQSAMNDRGYAGTVKRAWIRTFNRGIRYMNAGERSSYRVEIRDGLLYQNGVRFDTGKMKTQHSGAGVAVFVQSADGTFYSSNHLGGRLVTSNAQSDALYRSTGEWKVEAGSIQWISGESGFCNVTPEQLVNAINDLQLQNALSQTPASTCTRKNGAENNVDAGLPTPNAYYFPMGTAAD